MCASAVLSVRLKGVDVTATRLQFPCDPRALPVVLPACLAAQVHRKMTRASRDIRFDEILANACQDDRKEFCNDVQPVSALRAVSALHV